MQDLEQPEVRGDAVSAIRHSVSPGFVVLPPTTKFPHPAIASGDYGLCAVVIHEGIAAQNPATGEWFDTKPIDPERMAAEAALDLAAAARAPFDRVTGITWLRNTFDRSLSPAICASPNPRDLAAMAEDLMARRLTGSSEPVGSWLTGYASAALGPKSPPSTPMRRFFSLAEHCIAAAVGDREITSHGVELGPGDLADPRFLLPALLVSAWEDWDLTRAKDTPKAPPPPGFEVHLQPDPSALLGYRVEKVVPAAAFIAMGPLVACVRRMQSDDVFQIDDLVNQFARYLRKNGLDATVVDDVDIRIASAT